MRPSVISGYERPLSSHAEWCVCVRACVHACARVRPCMWHRPDTGKASQRVVMVVAAAAAAAAAAAGFGLDEGVRPQVLVGSWEGAPVLAGGGRGGGLASGASP